MKKKRIDVISALIGSVIVDIEPILILFFINPYFGTNFPLHGFCHTFLIATLMGLIVGIFVHHINFITKPLLFLFNWNQDTNLRNKITWAIIMANIHVFLDAMLYPEMFPFLFWPDNPFLYILSSNTIYNVCSAGFLIGVIEYFIYLIVLKLKNRQNPKKKKRN
ncbi:MAG: hypothetical protein GY870_06120 [archaeon]|nr:hypothetical protein [archaeon]